MNKFYKVLLAVIMFACTSRVFAQRIDYHYSEWSPLYPSGLNEKFIESEVRYKWYKIENGNAEYINEYYANLDGYVKDEVSAKTFYRYITDSLLLNGTNQIVTNSEYCIKNWCYMIAFQEPTLIDVSGKDTNGDYDIDNILEISSEVAPYTIDNSGIYFTLAFISLFALLLILNRKNHKILAN